MNKNLESLRQQVADDKRLQEQMGGDMANLENKLRKFAAQNKELQGQVRPSDERLKIIVYTTGGILAAICFWEHIMDDTSAAARCTRDLFCVFEQNLGLT